MDVSIRVQNRKSFRLLGCMLTRKRQRKPARTLIRV
jgi:hypothetical protein